MKLFPRSYVSTTAHSRCYQRDAFIQKDCTAGLAMQVVACTKALPACVHYCSETTMFNPRMTSKPGLVQSHKCSKLSTFRDVLVPKKGIHGAYIYELACTLDSESCTVSI